MKTLSVISYAIGCILLMISCFTVNISLTWWLGGIAVLFLIGGCVFQFNVVKESSHHNRYY